MPNARAILAPNLGDSQERFPTLGGICVFKYH